MKQIFVFTLAVFCSLAVSAQAYEGTVKIKKVEQPAIIMAYTYPKEVVENGIKAKMADLSLKGKSSKGLLVYGNSTISEIIFSPLDYSFKLYETGKRDSKNTTVYMIMEGSNALSGDPITIAANAKRFLQNLVPYVERSNIVMQIKAQEEIMASEEKKLKDLKDDQQKLEKKLEENKKDQEKQGKIIASQQTILSDLKARQ